VQVTTRFNDSEVLQDELVVFFLENAHVIKGRTLCLLEEYARVMEGVLLKNFGLGFRIVNDERHSSIKPVRCTEEHQSALGPQEVPTPLRVCNDLFIGGVS